VSEIEPPRRSKKSVAPRHIPQVVVPVPFDEARDFVREALQGTSLVNPVTSAVSGWAFFKPLIRFTPVDPAHTLIELDVVQIVRGADLWLFNQRRGEIDRFFVALDDELERRARWQSDAAVERPAVDQSQPPPLES
jgi:hypothetical protein